MRTLRTFREFQKYKRAALTFLAGLHWTHRHDYRGLFVRQLATSMWGDRPCNVRVPRSLRRYVKTKEGG